MIHKKFCEQKTAEVPQIQFIDRAEDISVMRQRQVVQTVQKTTENPQAQFLDQVAGMPVVVQHKVPMIQRVQKTVEVPQIQYVDKIVDAPVAAAQNPVPMDAESLWVEEVSVGTQTVSRKRKLSMETESADSADGRPDAEPGLRPRGGRYASGGGDGRARPRAQIGSRGAKHGGRWLTPPGHVEPGMGRRSARDPPDGRVPGATRKETRRKGGRGNPEARAAGKGKPPAGGRSARSQPPGSPRRQDQGREAACRQVVR